MPRGDDVAELVSRYGKLIESVVARVAGGADDDLAAEVSQRISEALLKRSGEQTIQHPTSYIYRCAVRETVRELRRRLAATAGELEQAEAVVAGADSDPEEATRARELAEATREVLADLSTDRANAVRAHLAGLEVAEIMQVYAWPYQKARNLIARGMKDLRARLSARGFGQRETTR